ncbi:MAG TPA: PBP1A family penicillin-binding protein [Syntrophomonadaceae bacterium]|nr:PBP1A family penicillin-binding protein [Syntrophomonadaceae bacterium]
MNRHTWLKNIVIAGLLLLCLLPLTLAFSWGLPEMGVPEASVLYDINGKPIKGLAEQNRISVQIDEITPSFRQAIIAVEDKNFYHHHGIDVEGLARALYANLRAGSIVEGGSTITQQTAKKLFLSDEKTIWRKVKELYYAMKLERKYSKDEILALYCNTIYFGHGAYGVEVAARTFFGKSASDLTLAESALLAGLPNWPGHYDPYQNPQAAKDRQAVVLGRMVEEGVITSEQRQQAQQEALNYHPADYITGDAPYFVAMVQDYLSNKYGQQKVYQGGLKVYTTLDLDMQKAANQSYIDGMKDRDPDLQSALVALDTNTGQIRAMIGGRDFNRSNYNRVFANRQPGSTFKPFMYSLAMNSGFTPASMLTCEEIDYPVAGQPDYHPTDYGTEPFHWKPFTLKEAVMLSDNVIAVQVNYQLGPQAVANHAEMFGFPTIQPVLSLPLGSTEVSPLELCAGYSVFANQGVYNQPASVLKVTDSNGLILEENNQVPRRVVDPENAYIITNMLEGVMGPGGTGGGLTVPGVITAGKTGTTEQRKDAWFVGFSPTTCCVVWVGYDKDRNVNLTGSTAAGPIWQGFMKNAPGQTSSGDFIKPDDIVLENICLDSGEVATESCPRTATMAFRSGTQPIDPCYLHSFGIRDFWSRFTDKD